jgi:hypothetical protein
VLIPYFHPRLDQLSELGASPDRERIARHVRACRACQDTLRFIRRVEQAVPTVLQGALPPGVFERSLVSRANGVRFIAPAGSDGIPRKSGRIRIATIAAGLIVIAALALLSTRGDIVAGESESQLVVSPIAPHSGQRIEIEYRPAVLSFVHAKRLILRGRLRTARGAMYSRGAILETLASLLPGEDGVFRGAFLLPDSVVYVALIVEDSLAGTVDSRDGRLWTILVHDPNGTPTLEALSQRQNDFMGRSWEEAYASAKLNVALHPHSVVAWTDLEFFEKQLLGDYAADSLATSRRATIEGLIRRYRSVTHVPQNELSAIVWRSYVQHDTSALDYWYNRLRSEAPHHPQVAQIATVRLADRYWKTAPRTLLDSLESLWAEVAPVYGSGEVIITTGQQVARQLGDGKAYLRWVDRSSGQDSLFRTGTSLARFAPTREEGMQRIRAGLLQSATELQSDRPLTSNETEYRRELADRRRELLAALGDALIAAQEPREGLDTLSIAIKDGWDLKLLVRVASQRFAFGDTVGALAIEARIVADPRTSPQHVDSISRLAAKRLGQGRWSAAYANAQGEMVREVMNRALLRTMVGDPSVVNAAGEVRQLKVLTAGRPSVVVYWSRHCGPALEALRAIDSVGRVLRGQGIGAYLVVDESLSPEALKFFDDHRVGMPVLYDSKREVSASLRNFGTPAFYVLDEQGRIRFDEVNEVNDVLLQVAAIRAEASTASQGSAEFRWSRANH